MAFWKSKKNQRSLEILSESLSGRFSKETGECSYQGKNNLIVYKDYEAGVERTMVAEEVLVSEDSQYVYFRVRGKSVETSRPLSTRRPEPPRQKKISIG